MNTLSFDLQVHGPGHKTGINAAQRGTRNMACHGQLRPICFAVCAFAIFFLLLLEKSKPTGYGYKAGAPEQRCAPLLVWYTHP